MSEYWMVTATGREIDLNDIEPSDIDFRDIAHALSHLCRFNGHCKYFYSVAQHSVGVADQLPHDMRPYGLLHDAHEAYMGDIIRPLKNLAQTNTLIDLQHRLDAAIFKKAGLQPPSHEIKVEVRHADCVMLATEHRDLMVHRDDQRAWDYGEDVEPTTKRIMALSPTAAKALFVSNVRFLAPGDLKHV